MPAPGWNQSSDRAQPGLGTLQSQEKGAGGSRMGWTQAGANTGAQESPNAGVHPLPQSMAAMGWSHPWVSPARSGDITAINPA